jgi:hypothetical protein
MLCCLVAVLTSFLAGCLPKDDISPEPVVRGNTEAPAMCPWRDPAGDMTRFFPGTSEYSRDTLILSSYRVVIMRRLGKDTPLESNTLYAYRIHRDGKTIGTVLVRRAAGEYGAIEVVLAVDNERRIVGLRLQRHREPVSIAAALTNPKWENAFHRKNADDDFTLGRGLPEVPKDARTSANAVAKAVRSLLIEYDTVENALKTISKVDFPVRLLAKARG